MAEDAGSVEARVNLRLDNITGSIMTVCKKFDELGKSMLTGIDRPSEQLKATFKSLTGEIANQRKKIEEITNGKELQKYYAELETAIKNAEKAGETETLAMLQGQKESAEAVEKTIKSLERQKDAVEKAMEKAQGREEEARLATINNLQKTYEQELEHTNHLYELGVITAKEKDSQIQAAQMREIQGLEKLRTEYRGFEKELDKINKRQGEVSKNMQSSGKGMAVPAGLAMAAWGKVIEAVQKAVKAVIQFAKESIAAYQEQQIASARLGAVLQSTGANAWTSKKQLEELAKQQHKATGQSVLDIEKMQAVMLGFTSITGESFTKATDGLINMAAVMGGDLASAANQFGKALDNPVESLGTLSRYGFKFSEQQKKMVEEFEATGQHAKAQKIILDSMQQAFGNSARAVNDAVKSQNAYKNAIQDFKIANGENFERAVSPIRQFFADIIQKSADSTKKTNETREAIERLRKSAEGENVYSAIDGGVQEATDNVIKLENRIDALQFKIKNGYEKGNTPESIQVYTREALEADKARLLEAQKELIQASRSEYYLKEIQNRRQAHNAAVINLEVTNAKKITAVTEKVVKGKEDLIKITEAYESAVKIAEEERRQGLITEEQAQLKIADANAKKTNSLIELKTEYQDYEDIVKQIAEIERQKMEHGDTDGRLARQLRDLTNLQTQYADLLVEINTLETSGARQQLRDEQIAADKELVNQTQDYKDKIEELNTEEEKLLDLEKRRAIAAVMATDEYRKGTPARKEALLKEVELYYETKRKTDLQKEYNSEYKELLHTQENMQKKNEKELDYQLRLIDNWKKWAIEEAKAYGLEGEALAEITAQIEKIAALKRDMAKKDNDLYASWGDYFKQNYVQMAQDTANLLKEIGNIFSAEIRRMAQRDMKEAERVHNEKLKLIEEELNAKLIAAGFEVANNQESLEAQLEAAIRTGDEILIYQKERALEKYRIEEEYNKKKAMLEEEITRKKAELEYKAATAEWKNKIINSIVDTAAAMISAAAGTPGPWWSKLIAAGAAQTLGHIQTGIIIANPPERSFSTGGIVPGTSYSGDNVPARLNSREGIFTLDDQKYLFNQIQKRKLGDSAPVTATIFVMLDGKTIAQNTVNLVNNGQYIIKERGLG